MMRHAWKPLLVCVACLCSSAVAAAEGLHQRIDALIAAGAKGKPASAGADDAEFLRRVTLDLAGRIPTATEVREFLADPAADKRARRVDALLSGPDYPRRMQELFNVMLMERMGDNAEWAKYLQSSFEANKPWDQLAREILRGNSQDPAVKGAAFFYSKRLESFGQNPVDYPGLTRDVGRLFLGVNLQCCQCHDHIFIKEYKQHDFQGLHAFFQNVSLQSAATMTLNEKPTLVKMPFSSVFRKGEKATGPRIPGMKEIEIPALKKGEEYITAPDPKKGVPGVLKFSPLQLLSEQLPTAENPAFARNMANRLWFVMMGRGLVHSLDLHHKDNPASHPELLDLLAQEFAAQKYDIKWLLRELALSQTYQRSSVLPRGADRLPPESFLVANEKRVAAEQMLWSVLEATGQRAGLAKDAKALEAARQKFLRAFAGPRREPEEEFSPSLKAALFLLNDDMVLGWLAPQPGNLMDRLTRLDDGDKVADEMYVSVLSRLPSAEEKKDVADFLAKKADRRETALRHLVWALLASTEFSVNH